MSSQEPSKTDVDTILKRLRTLPSNKSCFDCGAKNPTWSSVTYGIFICIDCSATHRSLGVHLSFVKSTQLDTNWTWLQLRAMQLGGNANAASFFEQQNCTTKVAQQKYGGKAAQLYREKLHQAAIKAQRTYGTKLNIDDHNSSSHKQEESTTPTDFFHEMSNQNNNGATKSTGQTEFVIREPQIDDKSHEGPSVSALSNPANSAMEDAQSSKDTGVVKSTLLQKKPAPAKKKGLGAQKVNTDFKEIERAMEEQERARELAILTEAKNREEQEKNMEKQMASMKLAYNVLDKQREKEEAKLMVSDPKKAQQLERLGMAVGGGRIAATSGGISHSAVSDMQIIQQDVRPSATGSNTTAPSKTRDFFDEMETGFRSSGSGSNNFFNRDMGGDFDSPSGGSFRGFGSSATTTNKSDWVVVDDNKYESSSSSSLSATTKGPSIMSMDNDFSSSSSSRSNNNTGSNSRYTSSSSSNNSSSNNSASKTTTTSTTNGGDASKRFANAKGISSDQYFGRSSNLSEDEINKSRLNKFEGSSSISSEDYFGDGRKKSSSSAGGYNGPDMTAIKQDLREGVTRVAGRLSNMASNVMSSFQDRL